MFSNTPKKTSRIVLPTTPDKTSRIQDDKIISKRVYKDGLEPSEEEKMEIIKEDIEKLRFASDLRTSPRKLGIKHTRSLTNVVSFSRGLFGDSSIPEV